MRKHNIQCIVKTKFISIRQKEKYFFTVRVKKQPSRPCFCFGQQFKNVCSSWMFPWLDSEPLGDSLWRLWCTSDGLFFTFKEQEARRNRLRRPTQLKKPAYPVICRPGQVPLELLLLQNAEQSIWPQHWNAVLQRTKEDKLIFIDNDLFYKHKIYLSLNSLSKSEKITMQGLFFFSYENQIQWNLLKAKKKPTSS